MRLRLPNPESNSVHSTLKLFYAYKLAEWVQIDGAIWFFFYHRYYGLTPGEATSLFSLTFFISLLIEIPSSSWADRFSRKKVLIAAHWCLLLAYVLFVTASSTILLICAVFFRAIHSACSSGTMEGLLYDNLRHHQQDCRFNKVIARGHSIFFLGRACFMIAGAYLYSLHPTLPYWAGTIISAYLLLVCFLLPEHPFRRSDATSNKEQIFRAAVHLWRCRKLRTFLLFILVIFTLSDMVWVILQPYFLHITDSYLQVGIVYAVIAACSAFGSRIAGYLQEKVQSGTIMLCSGFCLAGTATAMAFADSTALLWCLALSAVFWGVGYPITMKEINQQVGSDMRATAGSLFSQLESFGIAAFGSLAGFLYAHDRTGFFLGIAFASFVASLLFYRPLRKQTVSGS